MATNVILFKKEEDEEKVTYYFGPNDQVTGVIEYNKITKKVFEICSVPDDETGFFTTRAAWKIAMIVRDEKGVFPDKTSFVS